MGCDGIWEKRSNEEAVEYVYEQLNKQKEKLGMDAADKNIDKINIKEIVENLLNDNLATDIASSQGVGCDNMTCIIILLKREKL